MPPRRGAGFVRDSGCVVVNSGADVVDVEGRGGRTAGSGKVGLEAIRASEVALEALASCVCREAPSTRLLFRAGSESSSWGARLL